MGSNVLVLTVQTTQQSPPHPFIMKLLLAVLISAQVFDLGSTTLPLPATCATVSVEVEKLGDDVIAAIQEASALHTSEHADQNALINELQETVDWLKKAVKFQIRGKKGFGPRGFCGHGYGGYGGYGRKHGHHGKYW